MATTTNRGQHDNVLNRKTLPTPTTPTRIGVYKTKTFSV